MKSWLGLVVAPIVALVAQSFMYSMVTPACSSQTRVQLHLAAAVALVIVAVLAVFAFAESSVRRGEPTSHDSDVSDGKVPRRFLSTMATAVATLSALVILGMWFALWVMSPCEP